MIIIVVVQLYRGHVQSEGLPLSAGQALPLPRAHPGEEHGGQSVQETGGHPSRQVGHHCGRFTLDLLYRKEDFENKLHQICCSYYLICL